MSENIDAYLKEVIDTVEEAHNRAENNIRGTDYTFTSFKETKQERLWTMKERGELLDSVLVTADGIRVVRFSFSFVESYIQLLTSFIFQHVHIDMLMLMEKEMTPFFTQMPFSSADSSSAAPSLSSSTSGKNFKLCEYLVDPSISGSTLKQIVYYAYHRRCIRPMTVEDAFKLATTGLNFKIHSLVSHVFEHLVGLCTVENVLTIYKLATTYADAAGGKALEKQMVTMQTFIEDHFQQVRYFFCCF